MNTLHAPLDFLKQKASGMVSTRERAVKTTALVIGGVVGAYFLWPTAAAPGAAGFVISCAAFLANPQLYFQILRTAGAAAAAAAFALEPAAGFVVSLHLRRLLMEP
ncbi:LOW QUALITY PROTEIN: hypothetical protein BRADI_1g21973v3 [Brachypodium distachyon]|uniref:Uncharacterized protein n=1 Tax=Brachypodium distachyon TaxID=15368 RepID=A0A2K2DKJ4_BRADI|nr:LOW QUALITY PROTEIN: hypothetical protein BRADI_1g21973v3 [Brachypodium distachyon]